MLAWKGFHPSNPPIPLLIHYIQDRDLWLFQLEHTKPIHAFLSSIPFDFGLWDVAASAIETDFSSIIDQGEAILRTTRKHIDTMLKNPPTILFDAGHLTETIEIVNCPGWMASDMGHELAKRNLFGLTYFDMKDKRVFSLRSAENGIDVSEIAKKYGGGGHKHASGFAIPLNHQQLFPNKI